MIFLKAPRVFLPKEFENFIKLCKAKTKNIKYHNEVTFDLSDLQYIDISCLLFFICVLNLIRQKTDRIQIILPDENEQKKVRAFLIRWKFFEAIRENVDDLFSLFPYSQRKYFDKIDSNYVEPEVYLPAFLRDKKGIVHQILSRDIVEITSFTKQENNWQTVNIDLINRYVDRYKLEKDISQIVAKAIGLTLADEGKKPSYEIFYKTFIRQSLINTKHHPNATVSLIAVSSTPGKSNLVISVVDNGQTIPQTISKVFRKYQQLQKRNNNTLELFPSPIKVKLEYDEKISLIAKKNAQKIFFACRPGVTSRKVRESEVGMGLTYLITDTIRLKGEILVRSGNCALRFFKEKDQNRCKAYGVSSWPGTMIRIQLPITKNGRKP